MCINILNILLTAKLNSEEEFGNSCWILGIIFETVPF